MGPEELKALFARGPTAQYRCAFDAHWTDEYNSGEIEAITGYPPSDFVEGLVRTWSSIVYPEDRALLSAVTRTAVRTRDPFVVRYRILHADGSLRWVVERGAPVFDKHGELRHLVGDIVGDGFA